jgi:glycosyltransferase involved in cell wall biosynthesis
MSALVQPDRSTHRRPRVTLGMPVYNGEAYLEESLRSLVGQTYEDFELIISDNASTDRTSTICRDFANNDRRIRYRRNAENVGFVRNQNPIIRDAIGDYFLLTHSDDVRLPTYLERTIPILDEDPGITVCYTRTRDIDEHGMFLPRKELDMRYDSEDHAERFRDIIRMDHLCEPVFGLTRVSALRQSRLHGDYADSDRVLLAELLLLGRFVRLPECLFHRRAHAQQSTAIAPNRQSRTVWYNPAYEGEIIFPHFRQFREYIAAINLAPVSWSTRASCYAAMVRWVNRNRPRLLNDVEYAGREFLRPLYYAVTRSG